MHRPTLISASMLAALALAALPTLASAQSTADKVEQKVDQAKTTVQEKLDQAADKTDRMGEKLQQKTDRMVDKVEQKADKAADKTRAATDKAAEKTKNDVTYKDTRGALRSEPDRRVTRTEPAMPAAKRDDRLTSDRPVTGDTRESLRTEGRRDWPTAGSQQHVRVMQQKLKDSGYDPGPIDGVMGPQTAAALKEYQKTEGLRVTGQADAQTLGKLGIGVGGSVSPGATPADPQATPGAQRKKQSP